MSSSSPQPCWALCKAAQDEPANVTAQIAAAGACDNEGLESEAVVFYDAAWKLGVPSGQRSDFVIGYGSTLRNVGRFEESERVLRQALSEGIHPRAARAFLALTLHAAGHFSQALAELLDLLLEPAGSDAALERYAPSLTYYAGELRVPKGP